MLPSNLSIPLPADQTLASLLMLQTSPELLLLNTFSDPLPQPPLFSMLLTQNSFPVLPLPINNCSKLLHMDLKALVPTFPICHFYGCTRVLFLILLLYKKSSMCPLPAPALCGTTLEIGNYWLAWDSECLAWFQVLNSMQ